MALASKNSLVVKDKTRKGKGCFLLWSLTRQSPVTDCRDIFHNYLASPLKALIYSNSWIRVVPVFAIFAKWMWMMMQLSPSFGSLFIDTKMYCAFKEK